MTVQVYNGRLLCLTVDRDWLSRAVTHVHVLTAIFLRVLFITTITPLGYVDGE